VVGEHSNLSEVRPRGLVDSLEETLPAQVAKKQMRTLLAVNLRVPEQGQSAQGQSVPKARPKGVADGQQVKIPVPLRSRYHDGRTQEASRTGCWMSRAKLVGGRDRQIRFSIQRREASARPLGRKVDDATLPRKFPKETLGRPYRKPTQVDEEKILRRSSEALSRNSAN
jgi:hypothetical protein